VRNPRRAGERVYARNARDLTNGNGQQQAGEFLSPADNTKAPQGLAETYPSR
jgi:hypothetical protein